MSMQVVQSIVDARSACRSQKRRGNNVGLVPTMGFLHEGHISLVRQARTDNDFLVVSIFVNPTQFSPSEDFGTYPRNFEQDRRLLADEGVDLIFCPSTGWQNQVPHSRFLNRQNKTSLFISNLDLHCLEFYSRPGSCAFIRSNYLAVLLVQTKIQEQAQEK